MAAAPAAGDRGSDRPVRRPVAVDRTSAGFEPAPDRLAGRSKAPSLISATSSSVDRRRLHAVIAIQQIPQRLVDAQRAGHVALLGMHAHQMAAGLFVGRIEIGDGGCDFGF